MSVSEGQQQRSAARDHIQEARASIMAAKTILLAPREEPIGDAARRSCAMRLLYAAESTLSATSDMLM